MSRASHRDGRPGPFGITRDSGERRRAGTGRAPGSVLIAVAAWLLALIGGGALFVSFSAQYAYIFTVRRQDAASVIEALLLDLLMIVFTLLALGLSRAGKSARAERALILACAVASSYMNVSAADVASPRSVAAYAIAPIALAVVVDRVVAVIRRHVLADAEPSAWITVGRAAAAAARIAGLVLLYCLRFALAAPETARGLRRMVLDAAPLPALPEASAPEADRAAPHQEGCPARPVPRSPGLRGPQQGQPGRCRTGRAGRAAGGNRPQLPVRRAGRQEIMTADPPAEPSPRALGESLAALAAQVADLRGQVCAINERLDRAGLRADVNLAARFEDLAQTVADALDAAAPADPLLRTGSAWTATPMPPGWPTCGGGPTPCSASTTAAMSSGTAGLAISTPSGNCPPWPRSGIVPMAAHALTWPGPWSSTTAGCLTLCAA